MKELTTQVPVRKSDPTVMCDEMRPLYTHGKRMSPKGIDDDVAASTAIDAVRVNSMYHNFVYTEHERHHMNFDDFEGRMKPYIRENNVHLPNEGVRVLPAADIRCIY